MVLQGQHTQHGGVAGRANRHGLAWRERRWQAHQPVAFEPSFLCKAAPMHLTDTPAVVNHQVTDLPSRMAGFDHCTGTVNASHHRPLAHHRPLVGNGQAILVIEGGVRHRHGDISQRQARFVNCLDRSQELRFVF